MSQPVDAQSSDEDENAGFNWDSYLTEIGGAAVAPQECFNQNPIPPQNLFEEDMKLEATDPRCPGNTCIATVIKTIGPRLRLRLDGADKCNDFYVLVDASDIHAIGYTASKGGFLLPPLGYQGDSAKWARFQSNILATCKRAPPECFRQKDAFPRPKSNMFEIGQKLEAVDRKNPVFICPATIIDIHGDDIRVALDGWTGAFDMTLRYDSRDIFPVGWCKKAGYPLNPPPTQSKRDVRTLPQHKDKTFNNVCGSPTPTTINGTDSRSTNVNARESLTQVSFPRPSTASLPTTTGQAQATSGCAANIFGKSNTGTTYDETLASDAGSGSVRQPPDANRGGTTGPPGMPNFRSFAVKSIAPLNPNALIVRPSAPMSNGFNRTSATAGARTAVVSPVSAPRSTRVSPTPVDIDVAEHLNASVKAAPSAVTVGHSGSKISATASSSTLSSSIAGAASPRSKKKTKHHHDSERPRKRMHKTDDSARHGTVAAGGIGSPKFASQQKDYSEGASKVPKADIVIKFRSPLPVTELTAYVNNSCETGPYLDADRTVRFPDQFGPASLNHVYREVVQALLNAASDVKKVYDSVTPGSGTLVVTADIDGVTHGRHLPFILNPDMVWTHLRTLLSRLGCCPNFISPAVLGCAVCLDGLPPYKRGKLAPDALIVDLSQQVKQRASDTGSVKSDPDNKSDSVGSPPGCNPCMWSVDDVVDFVASQEDDSIRSLARGFKTHEIDGKAFLLLNSELVLHYMKVKLGPALKVGQLIDRLRASTRRHQ